MPATALLPFRDPALPVAARVEDLLGRLTAAEKMKMLHYQSPAVERLGVPEYNWWNEALHGVARNGRATVFPQAIALAAGFDRDMSLRVYRAIAAEARAKYAASALQGKRGQYRGLTFWTPNINIFRDPRWGRGQETYGECPYLTAELGITAVRGLQGDDPARRLVAAACAKHFVVHSGPERDRHVFDARPTVQDFYETYTPAFQALVAAGVESVMGAYNRIYGQPCNGSPFLLQALLRETWGYADHVVSDCSFAIATAPASPRPRCRCGLRPSTTGKASPLRIQRTPPPISLLDAPSLSPLQAATNWNIAPRSE